MEGGGERQRESLRGGEGERKRELERERERVRERGGRRPGLTDAWKGTPPSCLAQLRRRERGRRGALAEESRLACSSRG